VSRLSILLDGKPVYLYSFVQGSYEDKRRFLCVHPESLSSAEIRERVRGATKRLPEEIEYSYEDAPPMLDLFEQAVAAAGFVFVDDDILHGLWLRASSVFSERRYLEECLDREAEAAARSKP
jgi:hypothetical protein